MDQEDLKKEDELIKELRRRVKGTMRQETFEDDHFFRRFLRARKHNINAAETMLKNHIKWREQNEVDSIIDNYVTPEFMKTEYITVNRMGNDVEGSPVIYLHIGHLDLKGLLKTMPCHQLHQFVVNTIMTAMLATRKCHKQANNMSIQLMDKIFLIFNFEGFSLATATHKQTIDFIMDVVSMYEANFPEILKRAYLINVSYYFFLVWSLVKPFLSPETLKKIDLFRKDGWKERLQNEISPEVLPKFLGGNRTDPDGNPMCKTLINFGGLIPESYYCYENQTCLTKIHGSKKLTVARSAKEEVTLDVLRPNSALRWEFSVKTGDISFSVSYIEASGGTTVVIPPQKITSQAIQSGMCHCKKSGTYVIEFDNTYSWLFGKEIYYTVEVAVDPSQFDENDKLTLRNL